MAAGSDQIEMTTASAPAELPGPSGLAQVLRRLAVAPAPATWAQLGEQAGPHLWRLAVHLSGDRALADDALQETLLLVRDQARRFTPPAQAADRAALRWMMAIAAHVVMGMHRRRLRRREVPLSVAAQALQPAAASATAEPEAAALRAQLHAALGQLSPTVGVPVGLYYLAGLAIDEVAATLRISPGAAKVRIHRGVRRLRHRLRRQATEREVLALLALGPCLDLPASMRPAHGPLLTSPRRAQFRLPGTTHALGPLVAGAALIAATLATANILRHQPSAHPTQVASPAPLVAALPSQPAAAPPPSAPASPPSALPSAPAAVTEAAGTMAVTLAPASTLPPIRRSRNWNQPITIHAYQARLSSLVMLAAFRTRVWIRLAPTISATTPVTYDATATPLLAVCEAVARSVGATAQVNPDLGTIDIDPLVAPVLPGQVPATTVDVLPSPATAPAQAIPGHVLGSFTGTAQPLGSSGELILEETEGRVVYALIAPRQPPVLVIGSSGGGPTAHDPGGANWFSATIGDAPFTVTLDGRGWHAAIGAVAVDLHHGNLFLVSRAAGRLKVEQVDVDLGTAGIAPSPADPGLSPAERFARLRQQTGPGSPVWERVAGWAHQNPRAAALIDAEPGAGRAAP